jgi:ABC-2 type transport system permease protein
VARFEYTRIVFRKRFLLVLLSPILLIILAAAAGFASVFFMFNNKPVGYVDLTGQLRPPEVTGKPASRFDDEVAVYAYPDESSGRLALDDKKIEALYVVEKDYFETGHVRLVAYRLPGEETQEAMEDFLLQNLAARQPEEIGIRLLEGSHVQVINADKSTGLAENQVGWKLVVPIIITIIFTVIIGTTSNYMLSAVVDEKTNRTVEILFTSVSPFQLMAGKMAGNLAIGLTQLLFWGGLPLLLISLGAALVPIFTGLELDVNLILVSFGLAMLGVIFYSALLTVLGSTVTETREAQQFSGLMSFAFMLPYFFMTKLMFEPGGTVAVVLSLIPVTAPMSMPFRMAFSSVPGWQILLSFLIALSATGGALWLAGFAFQRGIMQYHKRLRLRALFRRKGLHQ